MTRLALLCHIISESSQSGNAVIPLLNFFNFQQQTGKYLHGLFRYSWTTHDDVLPQHASNRTKSDDQRRCFLGRL